MKTNKVDGIQKRIDRKLEGRTTPELMSLAKNAHDSNRQDILLEHLSHDKKEVEMKNKYEIKWEEKRTFNCSVVIEAESPEVAEDIFSSSDIEPDNEGESYVSPEFIRYVSTRKV